MIRPPECGTKWSDSDFGECAESGKVFPEVVNVHCHKTFKY